MNNKIGSNSNTDACLWHDLPFPSEVKAKIIFDGLWFGKFKVQNIALVDKDAMKVTGLAISRMLKEVVKSPSEGILHLGEIFASIPLNDESFGDEPFAYDHLKRTIEAIRNTIMKLGLVISENEIHLPTLSALELNIQEKLDASLETIWPTLRKSLLDYNKYLETEVRLYMPQTTNQIAQLIPREDAPADELLAFLENPPYPANILFLSELKDFNWIFPVRGLFSFTH